MNILFFGSDALMARVRRQVNGQAWDIHRAEDPDHVIDYADTHSFQAAVFGLCEQSQAVSAAVRNAKTTLDIPVAIGLAAHDLIVRFCERSQPDLDIIVPECGNDRRPSSNAMRSCAWPMAQ